jgi:hypothetical protein
MSLACRVCSQASKELFVGTLLGKHVRYFECEHCGYVQTETPTWLDAAYANPINAQDTGIMQRNAINARFVLATLSAIGSKTRRVVDYAGGYGVLTRMLRDHGVDAFWADGYCENLLASGFDFKPGDKADLVTVFEAFEHFMDPAQELEKLLAIAPAVLISTAIAPTPTPRPHEWWYYGGDHGQHIGFFRVKTLKHLAARFGCHVASDGRSTHLISRTQVSPVYWRSLLLVNRFFPIVGRIGLRSKTWSDYLKVSGEARASQSQQPTR